MPVIPDLREQGQLRSGNPTPIGGPNAGALLGEEIQGAGQGLVRLGAALHEQHKITQTQKRNLDAASAEQLVRAERIRIEREVLGRGATDGSEPLMFEKEYDKAVEGIADQFDDEFTRQAVRTKIMDVRNDGSATLSTEGLRRKTEAMKFQLEGIRNKASANVRSGSSFEEEAQTAILSLRAGAGTLFAAHELPQRENEVYNDLAVEAVRRDSDAGLYEKARQELSKNYAQFIPTEKRDQLLNEIDNAEYRKATREQNAYQAAERNALIAQKKDQQRRTHALSVEAFKASDPASREATRASLEFAYGKGGISEQQYKFIGTILDRREDADDDDAFVNLMQTALKGKDLDSVEKVAMDFYVARRLKRDSMGRVLEVINRRREDKQFNDPVVAFQRRIAEKQLADSLGLDPFGRYDRPEYAQLHGFILGKYAERHIRGESPIPVMQDLIKKHLDPIRSMSPIPGVPGLENFDPEALKAKAKKLFEQAEKPGISAVEKRRITDQIRLIHKNLKTLQPPEKEKPKAGTK